MDRFFHVTEKGSTIRTEIMAGITTFMAMAYILMVNAGMFSNPFGDGTDVLGVSYGAIYVATAISAVVGTLLIGLLSTLPLAQASGMGLNAYFVYTVCVGLGLSYANALVLVLFDGIIFVLLTVTGLRKIIFDSIPHEVKVAISAGIGLFIAFIGMQNAGIVVDDGATLVNLSSFNVFSGSATWASIFPMLLTIIAVFAIGAMSKKKVKGAVLWGMLGGAVAAGISYYLKLKSFNDELDQDFHEYEEEETPSEETEEKTEPAPERTYITINSGKDTNAADDSVKKEETKDSEETACPEPTDEKDSVKEENVPEEKTSSVVVEDDTEEGKTE